MKKTARAAAGVLITLSFLTSSALAQEVSWKRLVGIIQANDVIGSGTGSIPGGFLPWTTLSGHAHVNLQTGDIEFVVRGLVFAAGNSTITVGTPGPITAVKGALICDNNGSAGGGNSVIVETPSIPLSATGDARFSGNVGSLPAVCSSEPDLAFVVRVAGVSGNPANGPWIANGAVLARDRDDAAHL